MKPTRSKRSITIRNSLLAAAACIVVLAALFAVLWKLWPSETAGSYRYVSTIAGTGKEFGEPFGVAVSGGAVYISDGQNDKIWRIDGEKATVFAQGLDTPSAIAFDKNGNLLVADTGSQTIRSVNSRGEASVIAGVAGKAGFADGDSSAALFNGPVGIAAGADGKIFVADTYNDRIRVIENGKVSTLAGSTPGCADGIGETTKFDTPSGIAIWQDKLLVADTGNRRVRVVESDGRVWTLAGNGEGDLKDGLLSEASFVQPTAVAVDKNGSIFIADGNAIRRIGGNAIPIVTTISGVARGIADGDARKARFNRPSGLAFDSKGDLILADSENRLVRRISSADKGTPLTTEQIIALRDKPDEFRQAAPARWPYDPPTAKRDIAGTLGEIRGEMKPGNEEVWYHNGLDIAGAYGETARFVRDEKVLRPIAVENFNTLRELIRMPTLGYIHIRLGRDQTGKTFGGERFQFQKDGTGKLTNVRVARGAKFKAGEAIGTLNPMNHVHLIAGRSGSEMNALDALILPGVSDSRPPVIENLAIYDQKWNLVETGKTNSRIKLSDKLRIVVRAYDQMDGNAEKRRLGVYKVGYQLLKGKEAVSEPNWTIIFDRMPAAGAIGLTYANGSHSGATGETIFNYIATNFVDGDDFREGSLDPATLAAGEYTLRVLAADYFGNTSSKDIEIEVIK